MLKFGFWVAAVVAVADQLSKAWLLWFFDKPFLAGPGPLPLPYPVTSFFNLVLTWNRGVSFGLGNVALFNNEAANAVLFTGAAAIIVTALAIWLHRTRERFLALALGLVIGGAIGNVIDRLLRGAVVDFLDFHWDQWGACSWSGQWLNCHFFAFNLADSAITVGVVLLVIDGLRARREAPNREARS
jgi:signal peptidase II